MANRYMDQFCYSLEKGKSALFVKVAIGATGAPTLDTTNSKGIKSITRNSAGQYTLVLQDAWSRYLGMEARFIQSSTGIPASPIVGLKSQSVATAGGGSIVFVCSTGAGAATDPGNGEELELVLFLKNSSAP